MTHPSSRRPLVFNAIALTCLFLVAICQSVLAQSAEFLTSQVRITVPINSTNSTTITNIVDVSGVDTNAPVPVDFSVTGLPTGAAATLTDTNGNALLSSTIDTNLVLTLNTTNIAEGVYTFKLNATSPASTNFILLVLQAAHIWNGSVAVSNNWTEAAAWLGGVPTATSDVVFGDQGAQTNTAGITNVGIDVNTTVASIRFAQTARTNAVATNDDARPHYHTLQLAPNTTLTLSGSNGFSLLRDQVDLEAPGGNDFLMGVNVSGGNGSRLVVSNDNANFALLIPNQAFSGHSFLNMTNLNNFVAVVSRMGLADYRLYPNYRNYNDDNSYTDDPAFFMVDVAFARTNIIRATYKDPNNYTNEFNRQYALNIGNNEVDGNGSGNNMFINLGQSNAFFLDSICLGNANFAIGNGGAIRFNPVFSNCVAIFRSTNNARMSVFTVSDGGGSTNFGSDTTRMNTLDFSPNNNLVDILVDRFYMSRDRTLIVSNENPVLEAQLTIGRGIIDANTAVLGFQEHDGKIDWPTIGGAQAYRNYCRADLTVQNGGTFRVNGTLTLGYTADTNPSSSANQFETRGTVTVASNSVMTVSNVVVDGGLNFYDGNGRVNRITVNQGTVTVTNTIGGPPGLPLDTLSMNAGTLTLFVKAGQTNAFVRSLQNPGTIPSIIKVASITGVTVYPTNVPLISYETATPFMAADMSSVGGGIQGYIINNTDNKTIDLFLTTNAPKNLVWRGNNGNQWDLTTKNWGLVSGGPDTNFSMGDIVTFNDTSSVTNIDITTVVVPNQTAAAGVTISNLNRQYTFNAAGGAIAGTAKTVKQSTGKVIFNAAEAGPFQIEAGTVEVSGALGTTTVFSNSVLVLTNSGAVSGGLISTGRVQVVSGCTVDGGQITIGGGTLLNDGTMATTSAGTFTLANGATMTNNGTMNLRGTGNPAGNVTLGCVVANYGTINNIANRLNFNGLWYGTGSVFDIDGGLLGIDGRINMLNDPSNLLSPGSNAVNSIGTLNMAARFDLTANTPGTTAGRLLIEVDYSNSQTNDIVKSDRWNNISCILVMTNINPGAGSFSAGEIFTIFQNNNGVNASNFVDTAGIFPLIQPTLPGPGLQWDLSGIRIKGTLGVTNCGMIWNGGGGIWSTNTADVNWQGPIAFSDGLGAILNDTAGGTTTISVVGDVFPAGTTNTAPSFTPGVIVSNAIKDYTIQGNGRISGLATLYKAGPATLTILTTNNFSGSSIIDGGTVVITNVAGLGAAGFAGAYNRIVLNNGATVKYIGGYAGTLRPMAIEANNGTIEVSSLTNLTAAAIVGPGRLTKTGPGTLTLNAGNAYSGGTVISNGTLVVNANDRVGSNTVTTAGGTLWLSGNAFTLTNAFSAVGSGSSLISTNPYILSGNWSGNGALAVSNTSILSFSGSMSGYGGTLSFGNSTGNLRFNSATNANNCVGSAAATFDLGTSTASISNHNGGNLTYDLGALIGGANTIVAGRSSNTTAWVAGTTYSIGANGSNTAFSGRILNGLDTVSVTKVGTGRLLLNGINAYTGPTLVSAGTLGGTGTIVSPVTVSASGTLAPGASIGTLTINNSLSLSGTTSVEVSRNGGTLTSDKVIGLTSVAYGGVLAVTNVGPDAMVQGNSFQLFNIGGTGNFTSITPALPYPLAWDFNPTTGVLSVTGPSPNLNYTNTGTSIQFSWSNNGTNVFKLQAQTNSLNVGISGNWGDYPGGGTSPVTVQIDRAAGNRILPPDFAVNGKFWEGINYTPAGVGRSSSPAAL